MIKTFTDAVKFLESFVPTPDKKHPGQLGLSRMKYLVSLLGNPQFAYPTIHVGGTSGKGSTATIIASILATKYKVGLHTSPHLVKVNERIKILKNVISTNPRCASGRVEVTAIRRDPAETGDLPRSESWKIPRLSPDVHRGSLGMTQGDISDNEFIDLLNEMLPVIRRVEKSKCGKPSYFEIVTALAFLAFQKAKVDIAVIEVGMGGRFDGTNVIKPLVSVLTNVGLDHTEILGNTVEEIAQDKVGIIKPGIRVVAGVKQLSVIEIVSAKCKVQSAKLSLLNVSNTPSHRESHGFRSTPACHSRCGFGTFNIPVTPGVSLTHFSYRIKNVTVERSIFDYYGSNIYRNLKLSLLGEYQITNASLAIRVIEEIGKLRNWKLGKDNIRKGLLEAFIPGRLEIVGKKPLVILDGAHNGDKAKALVSSIKKIFPKKKITTIIAIKDDKKADEILSEFLKISQKIVFTKFQLTTDQGVISSYRPQELLYLAKDIDSFTPGEPFDKLRVTPGVVFRLIENPEKALNTSVREAEENDLILVTGSLYLVGEIKKIFKY